ncbi:MAG: cobyrinate a,c-diamide synthase [Nitrospirae bacterium]|nr:cobyrinate a,c-diamide synthase [Candidatus Manganitrophaceae bacterium]
MALEKRPFPRLVIAGTHSGVGKTTVVMAITAALRRRGLRVAPFKVGPDYLDPLQHRHLAGRPCRNLDGWMLSREENLRSFTEGCAGADIALIEGMMGLFDGRETKGEEASTAEMAKWLSAPVLLVVDPSGMARSLSALLHGFCSFDPALSLSGVIFNRAGSEGHLQWLQTVAQPTLTSFGGLPIEAEIKIPERPLGLVHPSQSGRSDEVIGRLAELAGSFLDLDRLIDLARAAPPIEVAPERMTPTPRRCRIAVAQDEAFHFYYPDNLALLASEGAELVFFSPIHDEALPDAAHGLYLGGGYPELYAAPLSENRSMRSAIKAFAEAGGPVYAECGGMIYLARELRLVSDDRFEMVGLLPGSIRMESRLSAIGYVEVEFTEESPLLGRGARARGHEFHCSRWEEEPPEGEGVKRVYRVLKEGPARREGYLFRNLLASYFHLHFGSNPQAAATFVASSARWKEVHSFKAAC